MSAKRKKRQKLKKRLFTKNRLVILNEDTFEEIFSLKLTLMNVFVVVTVGTFLIIFFTTYIIAFTPLREYIPGYSSNKLKREATELAIKSDSLSAALAKNEAYIQSIRRVLTGDLDYAHLSKDSITAAGVPQIDDAALQPSAAEEELRRQVAQEDKYNLFEKATPRVNTVLFPPVKGIVTNQYDVKSKHYAVDVALPKNTPIKSVLGGTVIFADWTPTNGYVILIRHNDGFTSVYKHCESLTADQGDSVKGGEIIAIAGSTGEQSTGVHLHFELWKDGYPIDPLQFISFD
jgi:murein DD-endopeptidase MepM/ murein hydrolase activator NlpD